MSSDRVAVVGAGAMGTGIAQVAAMAGHPVQILDLAPGAAERAVASVNTRVRSLVAKGKIAAIELDVTAVGSVAELAGARVVVEAVVEDLAVKRALFVELESVVAEDAILASNTSSISPTAIGATLAHPGRFLGLHFFNPAPVMRLVEVVPGLATSPQVADAAVALAQSWGKTVVRAAPTPGFIVNRLARPFYAEALRVFEEQAADPATIDAVLTGAGGFRMGPFALMDLIGHDVNEAVTRSVWGAFGYDARFAPSLAQRALVQAGWLGRKAGRGFYDYADDATNPPATALPACAPPAAVTGLGDLSDLQALVNRAGIPVRNGSGTDGSGAGGPSAPGVVELPSGALLVRCDGRTATELAAQWGTPVVVVDRSLDDTAATAIAIAASARAPEQAVTEAAGFLQAAELRVFHIDDIPGLVVTRTVAMLVNLAVDARQHGIASATDIDTAMRLGTNYPVGPLQWGDRWGASGVLTILDHLAATYGDSRYRPSALLRRIVAANEQLT